MKKTLNRDIAKFIISTIVAWAILLLRIGNSFSADNMLYAIGEINAFDGTLFNNNIYCAEGIVSPRFVIDFVFEMIMLINGGSWGGAALVWIYFGQLVMAVAIANISKNIAKEHQIFCAVLLTGLMTFCSNNLAGFGLNSHAESISIGPALAFAVLGISFVIGEKKNYRLAWVFATFSIICHIHEGIYCCVVIFVIALVDSVIQRKILLKENLMVLVPIIALALVVIPSLLTDNMDISNDEFVYIYSDFRHPHHLVPSTWGVKTIIKSFGINVSFMMISIMVSMQFYKEKLKRFFFEAIAFNIAWIMAILLMYIFTEKIPVAFVSTMFFSKAFKYVYLIALIWLSQAIINLFNRKCFISGCLVVLYPFIATKVPHILGVFIAFITLVLVFVVIFVENKYLSKVSAWMIDFIAKITDKFKLKSYYKIFIILCLCLVGVSLFRNIMFIEDGSLKVISGEKTLRSTIGDELYDLATSFKENTGVEDEFLANPDDEIQSGWFQIVSERNCYVSYKVVPSCKNTLDDWYKRYMLTGGFEDKDGEEIKCIMEKGKVSYVLIDDSMYDVIDGTSEFTLFESSENDLYRIYKLN